MDSVDTISKQYMQFTINNLSNQMLYLQVTIHNGLLQTSAYAQHVEKVSLEVQSLKKYIQTVTKRSGICSINRSDLQTSPKMNKCLKYIKLA